MTRIPYVDPAEAPDKVREALDALPPLNIFRTLAHAESVLRPSLRFGGAILGRLELDPVLRELAILEVARQTDAEYEWVQHVAIGESVGVSDGQITALESGDTSALGQAERLVVEFTDAVVGGPRVEDGLFERLRRAIGDRQIVELLLAIGFYWTLARVMTVVEIDPDPPAGAGFIAELG